VRASYWDGVVASWTDAGGHALLRAYSDAVNATLVERWLPPRVRGLLKTDVFDEAVGRGLYPLLRERADSVVAVDAAEAAIARARDRYPELRAEPADVRSLPFEPASFGAVVSTSTLDHLDTLGDIRAAIGELVRVLEPGGILVLTLDNGANPLVALRNAIPSPALERLRVIPYATGTTCGPLRLRGLLVGAGLAISEMTAVMHVPRLLVRVRARVRRDLVLRVLRGGEVLAGVPTLYVTGQFVAARAVKL
jgi:SAM-dependent methyltransferase